MCALNRPVVFSSANSKCLEAVLPVNGVRSNARRGAQVQPARSTARISLFHLPALVDPQAAHALGLERSSPSSTSLIRILMVSLLPPLPRNLGNPLLVRDGIMVAAELFADLTPPRLQQVRLADRMLGDGYTDCTRHLVCVDGIGEQSGDQRAESQDGSAEHFGRYVCCNPWAVIPSQLQTKSQFDQSMTETYKDLLPPNDLCGTCVRPKQERTQESQRRSEMIEQEMPQALYIGVNQENNC